MKIFIMSLGGSVIVPDEVDYLFLRKFRKLVLKFIKKNDRFAIICGGGKTCRKYQRAAAKIARLDPEDIDWLGIHATRLNAHLLRTIFRNVAHQRIVRDYDKRISFKEKVLIASGWLPGWSTDYDAVILAKKLKAKTVINVSDIDYVYDKDPRKNKDAKPIRKMSWEQFRQLVGDKWDPGLNLPFDPVASKEAQKLKLKVVILSKDIKNLDNFLSNKKFKGTVIS